MNLIIVLPFVGIVAAVGLVAYFLRESGATRAATRLDVLVGKKRHDSMPDLLRKAELGGDSNSLFEKLAKRIPSLERIFEQADCNIRPSQLLLMGAAFAVMGMTGSYLARVPVFFVPVAGIIMLLIPLGWLWNKRRVRFKKFAAQLPYALELVARALRAGHSLAAGMHVVAEEMPLPISQEFCRVYDEQNLGIPLEDAMRGMVERVPNLDLKFL